jgi:phosphoribosyl 1,2-cyclic phosphodiesterase
MHTSVMLSYYGRKVMIDCGEDWLTHIMSMTPGAIIITHYHPDHAWGLKKGAPCPVFATPEAWETMEGFQIRERRIIFHRKPLEIEGIKFEAFPVEHSTRSPAVGYRIETKRVTVFYVPDVVYIRDREDALKGVRLYIGDGATISRSMVRKPKQSLIGHTPIRTQLTWCSKESVPEAIFTHCGSQIVKGDERTLGAKIRARARERHVRVMIAYDGMERVV